MKKRKLLSQSPVRETRKCYAPKFKRIYNFESSLERDCFNWLVFQPDVTDIECQPGRFTVPHNGKNHLYTPDFWVERGFTEEYVEVKPFEKAQKPEFLVKVARLTRYFESIGASFRVVTEKDLHIGQRAINYQLLRQARQAEISFEEEEEEAVKALFSNSSSLSMNQFTQLAVEAGISKCLALRAIAHGVVRSDLTLPFDQLTLSVDKSGE